MWWKIYRILCYRIYMQNIKVTAFLSYTMAVTINLHSQFTIGDFMKANVLVIGKSKGINAEG